MSRQAVFLVLTLLAHSLGAGRAGEVRPGACSADDAPNSPLKSNANGKQMGGGGYIVLLKDEPVAVAAPAAFAAAHPRAAVAAAQPTGGSGAASAVAAAAGGLLSKQDAVLQDAGFGVQQADGGAPADALGGAPRGAAPMAAPAAGAGPSSSGGGDSGDGARVTQRYTTLVNGFAVAGASAAQLGALRAHPDVKSVTPNAAVRKLTVTTPQFLRLGGAGGVWETQFGGAKAAGSNVLIGVIDSGIAPSVLSFASGFTAGDNAAAAADLDAGACDEPGACTPGKLVACRYFMAGFAAEVAASRGAYEFTADYATCADADGHGTHTASTAAGDGGAPAILEGVALAAGGMTGIAPGAAVAVYKALWEVYDKKEKEVFSTGTLADVLAATEKAVLDGVDVINFSLGFGETPGTSGEEPMHDAFKAAASAGVFVSASAGNDGDWGAGTVYTALPTVVSVAAGTHDRVMLGDVAVGGALYTGASASPAALPATPLWFAGAGGGGAALCLGGSLPAAAAGKVVVCLRGENIRVDKSAEVARANGTGMILVNVAGGPDNTEPDPHSVPAVHVNAADGAAILAAIAAAPGGLNASLSARRIANTAEAPFVAYFSSQGPAVQDGGAILKPEVLAPGVGVFAALPGRNASNDTGAELSGTSMAAPHIAGVAALLKAKHPSWSPAALKSAMMTTASITTNRGNPLTGTPFHYGAGQVDTARAMDPGLIYDAGAADYDAYACAAASSPASPTRRPAYCTAACKGRSCAYPQGLRDFNHPAIALPGLRCAPYRGRRDRAVKATRTLTFVGELPPGAGGAEFVPTIELPAPFKATIKVARVPKSKVQRDRSKLQYGAAGEARTFTLTVKTAKAAPPGWTFGAITWADAAGRWSARSVIAVECGLFF